jgi:hypothetical protein
MAWGADRALTGLQTAYAELMAHQSIERAPPSGRPLKDRGCSRRYASCAVARLDEQSVTIGRTTIYGLRPRQLPPLRAATRHVIGPLDQPVAA